MPVDVISSEHPNVTTVRPRPLVLVVVDGLGVAADTRANSVTQAETPKLDEYVRNYLAFTVHAAGESVGLPWGEVGNSETGHLNIGAGRIVYQDLPRINRAIWDKTFFSNQALLQAIAQAKAQGGNIHLLGLTSAGGIHSYIDHIYALLDLCKQQQSPPVFIHAILDGRDVPFNSGAPMLEHLEARLRMLGVGKIATIGGRFFAMDRDNHWERIQKMYDAMTKGESAQHFSSTSEAMTAWYGKQIFDEQIEPTVIETNGQPTTVVTNKDAVIFFNFRPDRARQLTRAFVMPDFSSFKRPYLSGLFFATMTEYEKELPVQIAFSPEHIECPLACVLSQYGLKQMHLAETEKYAHVTYFFNGGREIVFEGEEHVLIPSPRVASYDEKPEMSAYEITHKVEEEIVAGKYDVYVVNFANPDMVGHTGQMAATKKSVEIMDECLGLITTAALSKGGVVMVTADHGNAEEMFDLQTGHIDKEHTTSPVPVLIIGESYRTLNPLYDFAQLSTLTPSGVLADVAPTVLKILSIPQPEFMTGRSLI